MMYSEREVVRRERAAFENGLIRGTAREFDGAGGGMQALKAAVENAYPLPKVTRPRQVTIRTTRGRFLAQIVNGELYDAAAGPTSRPLLVSVGEFGAEGLRAVLDLLASPTEEVEAE